MHKRTSLRRRAFVPALLALLLISLGGLASGQTTELIGNNNLVDTDADLARGNCYRIDRDCTLYQIESCLGFFGPQFLTFTVHEGTQEFGSYTKIGEWQVLRSGTGEALYPSGPINVPLTAGTHVIVSVNWSGSNEHFFTAQPSQVVSFGEQLHGFEGSAAAAAGTITSAVDLQEAPFQRLRTSSDVGTNYCIAVPNSTGQTGAMGATGSALIIDQSLTLEASSLPPGQFGIFVAAPANGFSAGTFGSSNGNLCLDSTSIGRYRAPGQIQQIDASGSIALSIDISAIPNGSGTVAATAGSQWFFQAWHRDSVGLGSNLTNGLRVSFQ